LNVVLGEDVPLSIDISFELLCKPPYGNAGWNTEAEGVAGNGVNPFPNAPPCGVNAGANIENCDAGEELACAALGANALKAGVLLGNGSGLTHFMFPPRPRAPLPLPLLGVKKSI
jgi:hypothetical protein